MGFLDKLWPDDTVAGPRPETGLGRLRGRSTFSLRPGSGKETAAHGEKAIEEGDDTAAATAPPARVTMSIMIKRTTGCPSPANATPPEPSTPVTPFTRKGQTERTIFRRKSSSDAYERGSSCFGSSKNPTSPFEV